MTSIVDLYFQIDRRGIIARSRDRVASAAGWDDERVNVGVIEALDHAGLGRVEGQGDWS